MMDKMDNRELISALADGQLAGDAFARGVELASSDPAAREAWHDYHLIGDVLRSGELAHAARADRFMARMQERLRGEAIAAQAPAQVATVAPRREAANDGAFRWKIVAGVASVAAVSAIAWTLSGTAQKIDGTQLAATPSGVVLTSTQQGPMMRDPRLDELLAAHRQLGGAALVAPAGYLRNATFDTPAR